MPFGLQGAPGVFQEMIELLCAKVKNNPLLKDVLKLGHIGAFFDDCGLGAQTEEDHLQLLEKLFQECQKNQIRIKLNKCEFEKTEMVYLGYHIGYGWWAPSPKKVEAISRAKVRNLKELQSFLGGMNLFRRHVPSFSTTSHKLTDLLKKGRQWVWGEKEEKLVEELKEKLWRLTKLGSPKIDGEIVMMTDYSDFQGGATIFQWQKVDPEVFRLMQKTDQPKTQEYCTQGVNQDGTLQHNYPQGFHLVPLGYFSWKWNETRTRYHTYEKELLAGILAIAINFRILAALPIIWFCDNQATRSFLDGNPPQNP